jgi:uncharacterized membrane protein
VSGYGFDATTGPSFRAVRWAADRTPTLLDLPTGYVYSVGYGLNETGDVVGESCGTITCRAVRWTPDGTPTVLPSLDLSLALSINNSGEAVGYEWEGDFRAMHWSASGTPTRLARPDGLGDGPQQFSIGWDINDAGVVAGFGCGSRCKAIRWAADGSPTLLDDNSCSLCGSSAHSINSSGQVAGGYLSNAAIWSESGELTVLPNPEGYGFAVGFAINDAGQVAGYAFDSETSRNHAVIWSDGVPYLLPEGANAEESFSHAINADRAAGSVNSIGSVWAFAPITYSFSGFFQPVDNPAVVNKARAGSAVPVRFSLGGDRGLDIFQPGYPRFDYGVCGSGTEDAIEQTVSVTASGLTYNPANDTYTYNWKTGTSLVNQCGKFQLGLKDGSEQYAIFHFVR